MKTKLQEQIGPADKLNHVVEKQVGRLSTGHVDVVLDGGGVIVLLKMCLRYKSADCTTLLASTTTTHYSRQNKINTTQFSLAILLSRSTTAVQSPKRTV